MFDFTEKVAMITGASGNLGGAVARLFYAAGAQLALIDRHEEKVATQLPELANDRRCLLLHKVDLTIAESVETAVAQLLNHFGRIDMLVNSVGGYRAGKPLHETSLETLDFLIKLNAHTVLNTSKAVIPQMISQGSGKIVNIAAKSALQGSANSAAYNAAKSAVIRLTESSALEVRSHGINVNCILPTTIDTPQNRAAMPKSDYSKWVDPASLADVIAFLCSSAARDVHGAAIPVPGLS